MRNRKFLLIAGFGLILAGILAFIGVFGPQASDSVFGSTWWVDGAERWTFLVAGFIAVLAGSDLPNHTRRFICLLIGLLALQMSFYSVVVGSNFIGINLEEPADSIFYFVIGVLAIYSCGSVRVR